MHGKDINIPRHRDHRICSGQHSIGKSSSIECTNNGYLAAGVVHANYDFRDVDTSRADVEVDGKFIGNTPSSLGLVAEIMQSRSRKKATSFGSET